MDEVCVIGGSRYFGRRLITRLRDAGVRVTLVNRGSTPPPEGVTRLTADRDDEAALSAALGDRTFDAVVDQVLYTPVQAAAARRVFRGRTGRYVMTSTIEVYAGIAAGAPLAEAAVDPEAVPVDLELPWQQRHLIADHYAEGKRQAEAVLARGQAELPYVAVRTAHVLGGGAEDFTGRLAHYVERIRAGEEVRVHRDARPSTFVEYHEIADFLAWTAGSSFTGPVNACSPGDLGVAELCRLVGERVGREARFRTDGDEPSPFSFGHYYGMDNSRAAQLGYEFSPLSSWLPGVVAEAAARVGGPGA
ncbi:NAD-dependent epimerase/dehydratase family protein [Saccharothrix sp. ST-888]|uniref:NAD-dependent epimerase/dehydratase family protein n=1 Tax=Saccharothrix sp. ST-888 TaxID=1427391 RepID=UPI0005EBF6AB|nr:NAD-dependent epimerase/dehydratase family protein [Saccharothrix sp. ST-888]KJK55447.1 reductase [Saccharothrix sp. ST-888]